MCSPSRGEAASGSPGSSGNAVIDDFAHHPTAIRETLVALRARYKGRRLWVIFEPRSATSRRATFQEDFVEAFAEADGVVIAGLFNPEGIPSDGRLSPERLAQDIACRYAKEAVCLPAVDAIVDHERLVSDPVTWSRLCRTAGLVGFMRSCWRHSEMMRAEHLPLPPGFALKSYFAGLLRQVIES